MTDHARAIEAGARAIFSAREWPLAIHPSFEHEQEYWMACAQACIEAAIASGDLVPASAVAEMRERCAKVAESWFGNTIGKVSLGPSAQDAIAGAIRQLDTASACGDYGAAPPFKVGDRVTHTGCQESGTVTSTENGLVVVEFDVPTPHGNISVGRYDAVWFRTYPNGLILHAASSNGGGK